MANKRTHEQFVNQIRVCNPNIEVLGKYTRSIDRVLVRCRTCGYEWSPVAAELSRGKGCPQCKGKLKLTTNDFVSRMADVNSEIEILGEYISANKRIKCRCLRCSEIWAAVPSSLLDGHGCPNCAKEKRAAKRRKTHEQFIAELKDTNPDIEVVGRYVNSASPIAVRCRRCRHEWTPIARSIVNTGQGCPECSRKRSALKHTKSTETFVFEMSNVNPDIEIVGEYVSSKAKVQCRCLICDNTWKAAPSNLLQGYGCPRCAKTGTSFMEQFLCVFFETILTEEEVLSRDKSQIGRELDIVLPSFAMAIEIGSWYWHRKRLQSDCKKQVLCEKHGIDLITIFDSYTETEPQDLPKGTITYPFSLNSDSGYVPLQGLACKLARRIGIDIPFDIDWEKICDEASRRALPRSTEQFIEEINHINPSIEVLGKYAGSHSHIKCRCKVCEDIWNPTAGQLLASQGCPACGHRKAAMRAAEYKRKTPEQYEKEFKERNPNLELLSSYTGSLNPVRVRCMKCGHEWSPRAESVIRGNGCPICADIAKRKSQEEFLGELCAVNMQVEILGTYTKNSTPIKTRCKRCGHIWYPRPVKLLAGQGCPACAGKMKRPVRCIETGEVFESYSAAARHLGLSSGDTISAVCKGKRKHAGGFTWELIDSDGTF